MTTTAAAAARERMSRVDTAWLRMDNDVNLMMIVGVWLLTPAIDYETLCRRVEEKLLRYERFRQRRGPRRERRRTGATTTSFDIHRHVVRDKLVRARGRASARRCRSASASWRASRSIRDRPLWQFHLIEGYEGGSALIARVHHCIGDGIALISVMMTITDGGAEPPRRERRAPRDADDDGADWLADAVLKPLGGLSAKAAGARRGVRSRARSRSSPIRSRASPARSPARASAPR